MIVDKCLPEVEYKGQKCLLVYHIPTHNNKGERQCAEAMVYLSKPFDKLVTVDDLRGRIRYKRKI